MLYLAQIEALKLRRQLQRRARETRLPDHAVLEADTSASSAVWSDSVVERTASAEKLAEIRRVFRDLTPKEVDLIRLRFEADLSPQEISIQFGITANAVRVRLFRAISKLRRGLEQVLPEVNDVRTQR